MAVAGRGRQRPRRFLAHLVAALRAGNPDGVADTTALVETGGEVPAETVLTTLVNDLDEVDGTTVLTLDDYHVIDEAGVHDAVRFLLEHLPPRATLAMATRADPPLPLARLRLTGEVVVLYPSHRGGWQPPGDFGTIAMPLDQALETISTNPYFLQLRQDFE